MAVAGMIGFTAGIAIGAAVDNHYYYGPYGWHGGAYMYNDAWDDYYDHREDAREDWKDHREDSSRERPREDRARTTQQEQRTERQQNRQENRPESQDSAPRPRRGRRTAQSSEQRADPGADRDDRTRGSGTLRIPRLHAEPERETATQEAERHSLGRVLRLFERASRSARPVREDRAAGAARAEAAAR